VKDFDVMFRRFDTIPYCDRYRWSHFCQATWPN